MHPLLFGYPAITWVLPTAVVVGLTTSAIAARRAGLPIGVLYKAQVSVVVLTLLGAKGFAVVEGLLEAPPSVAGIAMGYRYPGAIFGLLLGLPLLRVVLPSQVRLGTLLDTTACGAGFAMAIMRINCFLSGCCAGPPCSYVWCVAFSEPLSPGAHHTVHPLQIYLMLNSLLAGGVALSLMSRRSFEGHAFCAYLALNETGRAILEYWRMPMVPLLQWSSFALGILGIGVLAGKFFLGHWTPVVAATLRLSPRCRSSLSIARIVTRREIER
jgi:prolipoprotein diacylglyceryltransferase